MTDIDMLRDEICRVGRSLFERGYVHATAGNISARLPCRAGFLITPTDACLGLLEPQRLAHVDADGLGPTVWHGSPAAAMATLEELEETARLWLMTTPRPAPLSEPQIDELRRHFGARW